MAAWLPEPIIFNTVSDGRAVAVLRNLASGERKVLPGPIYAISPDGKRSLSPNFTTLGASIGKHTAIHRLQRVRRLLIRPKTDFGSSIWTRESRVFSFPPGALQSSRLYPARIQEAHFLCHASFSPDGSRVVFLTSILQRRRSSLHADDCYGPRSGKSVLLAQEKVSHFDWIDNDTVLVWARFSNAGLARARAKGMLGAAWIKPFLRIARTMTGRWKKQFLAESYYKISIEDPSSRSRFGWPSLDSDGHPMIARSHAWIATDFYPDKTGKLPLILFNPECATRIDAHVFAHHPRSNDSDVKCDLHPRWSRDERLVAVDTCEAGLRQVRVLDVSEIVR